MNKIYYEMRKNNNSKGSVRNYWGGGGGSDICPHEKPKKIDPPLTLGKKIVTLPKIIPKKYDLPLELHLPFLLKHKETFTEVKFHSTRN